MERTVMLHQGHYQDAQHPAVRFEGSQPSSSVRSTNVSGPRSDTVAEAALKLNAIITRGFLRPYIDEKTRGEFANAIRLGLDGADAEIMAP